MFPSDYPYLSNQDFLDTAHVIIGLLLSILFVKIIISEIVFFRRLKALPVTCATLSVHWNEM